MNRALNLFLAICGLMITSPLFIIISLIIKLESKGPAIFKQKRVGKNGIHFTIYKFRTMITGTPDMPSDQVMAGDSRFTKSGKFLRRLSLDEIPQLVNIIKGDMNFVGPRPALYNQNELNQLREAQGIHSVRPGITGWAQINGRDEIPIEQKVNYDLYYVQNRSFWLDLKIIWLTFSTVASARGLYKQSTMTHEKKELG